MRYAAALSAILLSLCIGACGGAPASMSSHSAPTFNVPNGASSLSSLTEIDIGTVKTYAWIPLSYRKDIQSPWVLFNHGSSQSALDLANTPNDKLILTALLSAGYVVIASDYTDEFCWGNPQCVDDDANVVQQWKLLLNITSRPYVLAESMGGIVTWNSIFYGAINPRAVAAIYPVCSLANLYSNPVFTPYIQNAYGFTRAKEYPTATAGYDPMLDPPAAFTGFPILMWSSYSDVTVTRAQNEDPFAAAINAAGGSAVINTSTGVHGDVSNFDPKAVVDFFAAH